MTGSDGVVVHEHPAPAFDPSDYHRVPTPKSLGCIESNHGNLPGKVSLKSSLNEVPYLNPGREGADCCAGTASTTSTTGSSSRSSESRQPPSVLELDMAPHQQTECVGEKNSRGNSPADGLTDSGSDEDNHTRNISRPPQQSSAAAFKTRASGRGSSVSSDVSKINDRRQFLSGVPKKTRAAAAAASAVSDSERDAPRRRAAGRRSSVTGTLERARTSRIEREPSRQRAPRRLASQKAQSERQRGYDSDGAAAAASGKKFDRRAFFAQLGKHREVSKAAAQAKVAELRATLGCSESTVGEKQEEREQQVTIYRRATEPPLNLDDSDDDYELMNKGRASNDSGDAEADVLPSFDRAISAPPSVVRQPSMPYGRSSRNKLRGDQPQAQQQKAERVHPSILQHRRATDPPFVHSDEDEDLDFANIGRVPNFDRTSSAPAPEVSSVDSTSSRSTQQQDTQQRRGRMRASRRQSVPAPKEATPAYFKSKSSGSRPKIMLAHSRPVARRRGSLTLPDGPVRHVPADSFRGLPDETSAGANSAAATTATEAVVDYVRPAGLSRMGSNRSLCSARSAGSDLPEVEECEDDEQQQQGGTVVGAAAAVPAGEDLDDSRVEIVANLGGIADIPPLSTMSLLRDAVDIAAQEFRDESLRRVRSDENEKDQEMQMKRGKRDGSSGNVVTDANRTPAGEYENDDEDDNNDASTAVSAEHLKRDNSSLRSKCRSLRRERRRLQDRAARLESDLCSYRLENKALKSTLEENAETEAQARAGQAEAERDQLRKELECATAMLNEAREELKTSNARLAEAEGGRQSPQEQQPRRMDVGGTSSVTLIEGPHPVSQDAEPLTEEEEANTIKSMEEVIRAKNTALLTARREVLHLRSQLEGRDADLARLETEARLAMEEASVAVSRASGTEYSGERGADERRRRDDVEASLRRRVKELERENRRLRKKAGATGGRRGNSRFNGHGSLPNFGGDDGFSACGSLATR